MQDAREARAQALDGLVGRGVLTRSQADAVHAVLDAAGISGTAGAGTGGSSAAVPAGTSAPAGGSGGGRWAEVAGYVGGGLVLAAVVVFMATSWTAMEAPVRILLLAVFALCTAAAGGVLSGRLRRARDAGGGPSDARRRIGGALFGLAAVATLFAAAETAGELDSYAIGLSPPTAGAAAGLVVAAAGYLLVRSAPGLVAAWGMSVVLAVAGADDMSGPLPLGRLDISAAGAMVLAAGAVWIALAVLGRVREQGTALGLGAVTAYGGASAIEGPANYAAEIAVAVALFVLFAWLRRRDGASRIESTALIFAILAVTVAVPRLVWEVTDGEVSAAGVLLVGGVVLLLSSAAGFRLHRRQAAPEPAAPEPAAPEPAAPEPAAPELAAPESDAPAGHDTPAPPEGPRGPDPDAAAPPRLDPRDPDQRL